MGNLNVGGRKLKIAVTHMPGFLREPFLHFLVLGALVFWFLSDAEVPDPAVTDARIVITAADVERIAVAWRQRWQRAPSEEELAGMIREAVREQVLYREALALGLDRDDVVIRRQLRQKFDFVAQDLAYDRDPDDATLRAYHSAHPERYIEAARLSFRHILFSPDRRGAMAADDAAQALENLQRAVRPEVADLLGDATSLAPAFKAMSDREIEATFGPDFAADLMAMQPVRWVGPISIFLKARSALAPAAEGTKGTTETQRIERSELVDRLHAEVSDPTRTYEATLPSARC